MSSSDKPRKKSARSTDPVALKLYRIVSRLPVEDKALIHRTLVGSGHLVPERIKVIEQALARYVEETGDSLSKCKYERWRVRSGDKSIPSATYICTPFGSWSKALDALGESPAFEHAAFRLRALGPPPSDEQMLSDLRECARELDAAQLTFAAYHRWATKVQREQLADRILVMTIETFTRRFGSFANACRLAEVGTKPQSNRPQPPKRLWTDALVVEALNQASDFFGSPNFTQADYEKWRDEQHEAALGSDEPAPLLPSQHTIRRVFGSFPMAKARAGLISEAKASLYNVGRGKRIETPQAADGLVRAAHRLGTPFSKCEYEAWRIRELEDPSAIRPSAAWTLSRKYGGWSQVQNLVTQAMSSPDPSRTLTEILEERFPNA